ncbi:MAG: HlyD family efflux transporter periplasmic adaptor subunit [Planctomycetota bacterium]|nr:MAG: HlyD family efflux transporter periplasmic adaptor subunit [Planctomycetota bacterium]
MTRRRRSPLPLILVLLAAGAALAWGVGPGAWFAAEEAAIQAGAPVRRGPLDITVVQRGNLAAKNSVVLRSEIEGRTTILFLEPEGTFVEAGQVVAELDASALEDRLVAQDIAVQNAQAAYTKAVQDRTIQISQNDSDIARAEQDLEFARLERTKYLEGDWPQQLKKAEEDIILAEEELAQARQTWEWSKKLYDKGFYTRTQLDRDELTMNRSQVNVERARRAKELLEQFDDPKRRKELNAAVVEAERELERVKLQAAARLVDHDTAVRTAEARLALEKEKMEKLQRQVEAATIRAPISGMLVYGRTEGGRMGGGEPIQEGTEVRERQEIATIPREAGMIVEASLHESVLKMVEVGQDCLIRVDALPDQTFHGKVEFVALLPDRQSWWANPNQRLFKTQISIADGSPEMRPGMSCSVEILVDRLEDVLYVPVQSIFVVGGKTVVFVVGPNGEPEPREVEVGPASEKWASIVAGVEEGERVLLSAPPGFRAEAPNTAGDGPEAARAKGARRGPEAGRAAVGAGGGRLPAAGRMEGRSEHRPGPGRTPAAGSGDAPEAAGRQE